MSATKDGRVATQGPLRKVVGFAQDPDEGYVVQLAPCKHWIPSKTAYRGDVTPSRRCTTCRDLGILE